MEEKHYKTIHNNIFDITNETYAIIDGASCPELLPEINRVGFIRHVCLYNRNLTIKQAEVAPYLIHLRPFTAFTKWLIINGWGNHWGIFVNANTDDINKMVKHFRKFVRVIGPDGNKMYFRFYDPRVLNTYLPIFDEDQIKKMYQQYIISYISEDEKSETLIEYTHLDFIQKANEIFSYEKIRKAN